MLKDFSATYAICGGYALEMFTSLKKRTHSDLDITLFGKDRKKIIAYLLHKGWNVYEPIHTSQSLRQITDPNDQGIENRLYIWALKPACTLIRLQPKQHEPLLFHYEILQEKQTYFDFIDIIFNQEENRGFVCDGEKGITRSLEKAILSREDIPYLAPEIILFFTAHPAYLDSAYHRHKTNLDWETTPPLLPQESLAWLIESLRTAYPEGNKRIDQLLALAP